MLKGNFINLKYLLYSGRKRIIQSPEQFICITAIALHLESGWWQRVWQYNLLPVRRKLEVISCPRNFHHNDDDEDDE